MRINKFLATCGVASRRKSEDFILNGQVKVNDMVIKDLSFNVDEKKDVVKLNDEIVKLETDFEYYLLNKPKGFVCTNDDNFDRKKAVDLINSQKRIYTVGRLDCNSEGMIILTNDGDLTYKLTHPSNEVPKTYIVKILGRIKESEKAVLRKGVVVNGVRYSPCKLTEDNFDGKCTRLKIVIKEGKNHEIRNMFEFIGKEITLLKRVQIGDLKLGNLNRGEYRKLRQDEIEYLKFL